MADKEATLYVVDLGESMGRKQHGRAESDLDWAMTYVWEKITTTVATDRKTATLGVIGFRTSATDHEFGDQDGFSNISVLQDIGQLLLPGLQELRPKLRPSTTDEGDAISAVVIAIQMIANYCKKLKYKRKIILVTNACGHMDDDDVPSIVDKLTSDGIELVVIGVDFDDAEYGYKEEDKDPRKLANEQKLQNLVDQANGLFGTMQQAIEELGTPRLKSTRPVPSYKGQLTLGNAETSDAAMCIDVERYPRVMVRRPAAASNVFQPSDKGKASAQSSSTVQASAQSSSTVQNGTHPGQEADPKTSGAPLSSRMYQVEDAKAEDGKRRINREDLARGYEYGRTAVHISESDLNVTKLETQAGMEIMGFVPQANYHRYMNMSVSCVTIAQKTNNLAAIAFSSLIHALYELESYAIARLVTKADKEPVVVLLAPSIEADYECLLDVQVPFAEDLRPYKFPPLDKVITVSGKKITEHRHLPSDSLNEAMSDLVDDMDLSNMGRDEEGNPTEFMSLTDTFSPVLHRIDQAVRWRAVHSQEPIPPPYEILTRYSKPPHEIIERSKGTLAALIEEADVKQVPPKAQSRKRARNQVKPLSGLDVGSLLGKKSKKAKLSPDNAIPEFRQTLDSAESLSVIHDAAKQMGAIIETQIKESFGDLRYQSALEKLGVLRDEMIEIEEPLAFNQIVISLKTKLLAGDLNGDRREMWRLIQGAKLSLIPKSLSSASDVDDEQAKTFLAMR